MDHALTTAMKMVVENDSYTFRNVNEPAMAETAVVSSILPDPVLESAKSLLDSMSTSTVKIAKMLKPAKSPVINTPENNVKSGVGQTFGYQRKTTAGPKINRYRSSWKPAVPPQIKIPDVNLKTTVASNEISLTLEPVLSGNNSRKVPYYARRSFTEFTFQPMNAQIIEVNHDNMILEWHRKHVQKLVRLGPPSKSRNSSSNFKSGNDCHRKPCSRSILANRADRTGFQVGQKRKYSEISDRYYQYLNKPKRARHDAFQVIFRSHILLDHVETVRSPALDDRTLYPRKFLAWPSGKVVMPGYYPQRYFDKSNRKNCIKRKRTWSMYRVPKPRPLPIHRVTSNKNSYASIMKRLWNKKLAAEDRLKWDPTSRKFLASPGQQKPAKPSNSKQWFRFPSVAARRNPIHHFNMSTNSQAKKYSNISTPIPSNWKASVKHEPTRNIIAPPRAQHKLRDIRDIFKCRVLPSPIFFESYSIYSNISLLFQIRRLLSFKAMKQGRLEKKVYFQNEEDCEGPTSELTQKPKPIRDVKLLSSSVLISSSTESMLSSWSTSLDRYSRVQSKGVADAAGQNNSVSNRWLHICSGPIIDCTGIAYPDNDDVDVPKEVMYAWALDEPCNDTFTTTHVINSSSRPAERSRNEDTPSGKVHCGKRGSGSPDSVSKMQRLRSSLNCSPYADVDMRRQKTLLPKLGYCVRYRFGFCSLDCACDYIARRHIDVVYPILPYEYVGVREKKVKPSWGNGRVESTYCSSVEDKATTAEAVMQLTDSRQIAEDILQRAGKENAEDHNEVNGNVYPATPGDVVAHCAESAVERMSKSVTCSIPSLQGHRSPVAQTVIGFSDHDGKAVPCRMSKSPLKATECLYRAEKSFLSRLVRCEHEVTRFANYNNSRKHQHSETNVCGSDGDGSHCYDVIGRSNFEFGHPVRALEVNKRSLDGATNHDASNDSSASEDANLQSSGMGNSLGKRALLDGLGTILQGEDCLESSHFTCETSLTVGSGGFEKSEIEIDEAKELSLSPKADILKSAVAAQKPYEPGEWMVIDSTFEHSASETPELSDTNEASDRCDRPTTLRSYANSNDAKKATSDSSLKEAVSEVSTFSKASELVKPVNIKPEGNSLAETTNASASPCVLSTSQCTPLPVTNVDAIQRDHVKRSVSPRSKVNQEPQNAEGDEARDSETRSSRRLRSRANCKKRGRYETDYVSDIPKASKKPKKVYPTNDYDNEEFWHFYSRCENTVYSQNLLLQYKYIKLFKSKGITSDCTLLPTQFSNSISPLPSSNKRRHVVPKSGMMPVLEKYTKQRKAPPDLPTVSDDHCAYCGRSFAGRERKEYESHVARHGMQYQVLSVPRLPKKKKKILKAAKRVGNLATTNGGITNDEAKEILLANSQNQRFSFSGQPSHGLDSVKPLSRPSFITMGHRKQTARKSFSITSTLPKDVLIQALQCEMRAKSTNETQPTRSTQRAATGKALPDVLSRNTLIDSDVLMHSYLPKPSSARKTLTGLPITYNHLDRNFL